MDKKEIQQVLDEADCLHSATEVNSALDKIAKDITRDLQNSDPIILCVMSGGIIPTGHLLTRLSFPLQVDYVHATRYRGKTKGGTLHWLHEPILPLKQRTVLIIDDIFDEGITLQAIVAYCKAQGATNVLTAVLVDKIHNRKISLQVDYIGLKIKDRYLFGYGMDYQGYLRNINGIYAVKGL